MSLLQTLLQVFDVEPNYDWGNHKIEINGKEYTSVDQIPNTIIETNRDLSKYKIFSTMTKKQFQAFIIFRLVDKLKSPRQRQQLKLTETKIPDLLFNEQFMNTFCSFLKLRVQNVVYSQLESRIYNKFRQQSKIQQFYFVGSDLRKNNNDIVNKKAKEADQKWDELVKIAHSV